MKFYIQLSRYAMVGIASNLFGYILYLLLTNAGMGYKTAMTLLYMVGVLYTFVFNKKYTFKHQGPAVPALKRYIACYGVGYVIQYLALWFFADNLGFHHQYIQGVMIIVVALVVFLIQKYWVFSLYRTKMEVVK